MKILVSGCLLGEEVRYDGGHQLMMDTTFALWRKRGWLVSLCPEVAGGLGIPRPPAEQQTDGRIITVSGVDVTRAFNKGAEQALRVCQRFNIKYALLKESSPSCGSTTIYNGDFSGVKIAGMGVTAQLLSEHGIKVFSEKTFAELVKAVEKESS